TSSKPRSIQRKRRLGPPAVSDTASTGTNRCPDDHGKPADRPCPGVSATRKCETAAEALSCPPRGSPSEGSRHGPHRQRTSLPPRPAQGRDRSGHSRPSEDL